MSWRIQRCMRALVAQLRTARSNVATVSCPLVAGATSLLALTPRGLASVLAGMEESLPPHRSALKKTARCLVDRKMPGKP